MSTQHLKTMLQDIINDRPEQAQAAMHEYFIAKSRELTESKLNEFFDSSKYGDGDRWEDEPSGKGGNGGPSGRDFSKNSLEDITDSNIPKFVNGDLYCSDNNLIDLIDIHKKIKSIKGTADFSRNRIKECVLGLLMIDNLKAVRLDNKKVEKIINSYLGKGGKPDVGACKEELIAAGFGDFAKFNHNT